MMENGLHISPFAPASFADLPAVAGVRFTTIEAGIKYKGRTDVLLCVMDEGTQVAGVLTKSLSASAPVDWCRAKLANATARALIVNSGNANAFTGRAGVLSVEKTAFKVAKVVGCHPDEVFIASTGVIGEQLDPELIIKVLDRAGEQLSSTGWLQAAQAIMTTDTFPKLSTASVELDSKPVTISAIAKGSGMIAPDMATMLAFVFTDAALPAPVLQTLLREGCDKSFNSITVDSDTSTSDTLLLFATGVSGAGLEITDAKDPRLKAFTRAINELLLDLAHQVVKDGEGAKKFICVNVCGAQDDGAARRIGLAIANSPLVKTAIAGEDANWGRIVMAVGKSEERAVRDKLKIWIGGIQVAARGQCDPGYREEMLIGHMKGSKIDLKVDVGVGKGAATVWTCDLTHRYIDINADYRR